MSTGLIIALIVVVAVVVVAVAALAALRARRPHGGRSLRRRFGPEYDRAVARHDGDTAAAERELAERVERHGDLHPEPLEAARRERFEARWTAAQELFVDAPRAAVSEADHLLAEAAEAKGFPDSHHYDEQLSALSVHHAAHVEGYRHVHRLAQTSEGQGRDGRSTEEMREAMVEARELFEDLVGAGARTTHRKGSRV
ncbi:hypothetical protein [Streptomyces sp. NPDC093094]|uniref:hypothetical protein n=1 Tax=Streptomyces sp. NPDC093094 TaxID=3366026 RepID=UPI00382A3A7F